MRSRFHPRHCEKVEVELLKDGIVCGEHFHCGQRLHAEIVAVGYPQGEIRANPPYMFVIQRTGYGVQFVPDVEAVEIVREARK